MKNQMVVRRNTITKKVRFDSCGGWTDATSNYSLVNIDHNRHTIEFEDLGGGAPLESAVLNFLFTDRDVRQELIWAAKHYTRKYPIFSRERVGMSGCYDISLFVSKTTKEWAAGEEFKLCDEVVHWHVSCNDKMNEGVPELFAGDLLSLLQVMFKDKLAVKFEEAKKCEYAYVRKTPLFGAERVVEYSLF